MLILRSTMVAGLVNTHLCKNKYFTAWYSLSAGPLNPGHQCPCLKWMKSLVAQPNFPWKNINTAYFEAKRKVFRTVKMEV